MTPKFQFGNIVVVDENQIGVIVKSWKKKDSYKHGVYVRAYNVILDYPEDKIKHFVYSKELHKDEEGFY